MVGKKTALAATLIRGGRFRIRAIAKALGISRSNLYDRETKDKGMISTEIEKDELLVEAIKELIKIRPTYGYRRVTALLNHGSNQPKVNYKRVYRLMKLSELLLPKHGISRPSRTHTGQIQTLRSNTRWCSDYFTILVGIEKGFMSLSA